VTTQAIEKFVSKSSLKVLTNACESVRVKVGKEVKVMRLINLTPHPLTIRLDDENDLVLPPSGQVARVAVEQAQVAAVGGIPIVATVFGAIEGLPAPEPGVLYITSSLVAQAAAREGRVDVVAPDTGPTAVRDTGGQIIAVRRLQTFAGQGS
jgi:D-hexose-6-phosphate mutarotase